jgi:hypothetical protein
MRVQSFSDIKRLYVQRIDESDILDYKEQILDDLKIVKHVSSFANAKGGTVIFGIEAERDGGPPKSIQGIPEAEIKQERTEQIILGNIYPRLAVSIRKIPHEESAGNPFLVIDIPNSYLKPHMVTKDRENKYYIRRNFQAEAMDEIEVADAYKRRFQEYEDLRNYIPGVLNNEYTTKWEERCTQIGHLIVIPTILASRIMKPTDDFSWIDKLPRDNFKPNFPPQQWFIPAFLRASSKGVIFTEPNPEYFRRYLELHRNGCIDYVDDFGYKLERLGDMRFNYPMFISRLLQIIKFARIFYSRYNYLGDVELLVWLGGAHPVYLYGESFESPLTHAIRISRELPIEVLDDRAAKDICDEVWNNFHQLSCDFVDENGIPSPSIFQ